MIAASTEFNKVVEYLGEYLGIDSVWDIFRIVIDIMVVSYCFYLLLRFVKESRAFHLLSRIR